MTRSLLLAAIAALFTLPPAVLSSSSEDSSQTPLSSTIPDDYECTHPPYKIHIVSKSPSVIYISNFITPEERLHLQEITKDTFSHSRVLSSTPDQLPPQDGQRSGVVHSVRTSQSTTISSFDPIVSCISTRALSFQGFSTPLSHLEPLQLVKYNLGERYHFHTDWFTSPQHHLASQGGNRVSSFFAYVKADNVTGGGTNFPLLDPPNSLDWCDLIDCDEEYENGVTFKPVEGNAVYWENLHHPAENGVGDQRTLHAGLPLTSGEKIGMNIWTRQAPLSDEVRGAVGGD